MKQTTSIVKSLTVKVVFTVTWPNTLEVGDVSTNLLDGLHLLMQEVALNEVGHLWKEKGVRLTVIDH